MNCFTFVVIGEEAAGKKEWIGNRMHEDQGQAGAREQNSQGSRHRRSVRVLSPGRSQERQEVGDPRAPVLLRLRNAEPPHFIIPSPIPSKSTRHGEGRKVRCISGRRRITWSVVPAGGRARGGTALWARGGSRRGLSQTGRKCLPNIHLVKMIFPRI